MVPDAQSRGARVGEQNVAFHRLAGMVDHHVDGVASFYRELAGWRKELVQRHDAFGLVAKVDNDVFLSNAENVALQHFVGGWRRKMAVVLEQMLVAFGN